MERDCPGVDVADVHLELDDEYEPARQKNQGGAEDGEEVAWSEGTKKKVLHSRKSFFVTRNLFS